MTLLYWDSEMYKRSTRTRQKNEGDTGKDYKEMCRKLLFEDAAKHFTNPTTRNVAQQYKRCFTKIDGMARPRDYRKMYDALIAGDPKLRTLRALYSGRADEFLERHQGRYVHHRSPAAASVFQRALQ